MLRVRVGRGRAQRCRAAILGLRQRRHWRKNAVCSAPLAQRRASWRSAMASDAAAPSAAVPRALALSATALGASRQQWAPWRLPRQRLAPKALGAGNG